MIGLFMINVIRFHLLLLTATDLLCWIIEIGVYLWNPIVSQWFNPDTPC